MNDEVIKLILQVAGQDSIDNLQKSTANYKLLIEELVRALARGDISADEFAQQEAKLSRELSKQTFLLNDLIAAQKAQAAASTQQVSQFAAFGQKLEQAEAPLRRASASAYDLGQRMKTIAANDFAARLGQAAAKTEALATGVDKAARSGANMGRTMLESGRIIQDFAQGGIGGVLNNIEGLTMALGLGGGLAGVLTIAGVAAAVAGPQIMAFFRSLGGGATETEKVVSTLDRLEMALKRDGKELDELREKTHLNAAEIERYNELTQRTVELEQKKTAEMEKQARIEALKKARPPTQEEEEKETKEALADQLGNKDQITRAVLDAMPRSAIDSLAAQLGEAQGKLADTQKAAGQTGPAGALAIKQVPALEKDVAELQNKLNELLHKRVTDASDLVARALLGGNQAAVAQVAAAPGLTDEQREAFRQASPAARQADRDFDAGNERAAEKGKRRRDAEKAAQDAAQKADAEFTRNLEAESRRNAHDNDRQVRERQQAAKQQEQARKGQDAGLGKAHDATAAALDKGGLGVQARQFANELAGQGFTQQQIEQTVAQQLRKILVPRLGMIPGQKAGNRMAHEATEDVSNRLLNLQGQGMNFAGAQMGLTQQLNQEMSQMAQQLAALWQALGQARNEQRQRTRTAARRN